MAERIRTSDETDVRDGTVGTAVEAAAAAALHPSPTRRPARRGWLRTILRIAGFSWGAVMVMSGLGMIIAAPTTVLPPDSEVATAFGLGLGGGAVLAIGLALVRLSHRPLLQFGLILTGLVFFIAGIELLVVAIPLVRMSSVDIDPDRARLAFPATGGALVALGLAVVLFVLVRWLRDPQSRRRWPEAARWAAIAYGGLLLLGGLGIPTSIAAATQGEPTVQDAGAIGAVIVLVLLPGAVLAFHGLTAARARLGGPFAFFPAGLLFVLFGGSIALGAVVVTVQEPLVWLMPAAHGAAALLPALAVIALASRGGLSRARPIAGVGHRQLWLALALGVIVVTTVAGLLDGLIAEALGTALLAASGAFDGLRTFDDVTAVLRNPDLYLSRGQEIFLLLTVVVVMAPIMEEGFKGMGVALVLPRHPTRAAALTLGVAVGAGFGVFEATAYGLGGLETDQAVDWWALMLIRAGATTMHALNTGLLGLALYYDRSQGRLRRAFLLYLAAVALHGLWNGLAVLAGSRVIFSFEGLSDRQLAALAFGVMASLGLVVLTILFVVARRAYRASPKVGEAVNG